MGYTAADVIRQAQSMIGYLEKRTNAQLFSMTANAGHNNYQRFGYELFYAGGSTGWYNGNKNGYEWCAQFADWCHWMASGKDMAEAKRVSGQTHQDGAGVRFHRQKMAAQGRIFSSPKPGDYIYLNGTDHPTHVGLVEYVDGNKVYTIEGNAGDQVKRLWYTIGYDTRWGFGRPFYDEGPEPPDPPDPPDPPVPPPPPTPTPTPPVRYMSKMLLYMAALRRNRDQYY